MNKIIKLLQSGNFTLAYHDNEYCTLHEGRKKYEDIDFDKDSGIDIDGENLGYAPSEVVLLVKALGGKVDSI